MTPEIQAKIARSQRIRLAVKKVLFRLDDLEWEILRCKNCGKGRPTYWTAEGGFCDSACWLAWRDRQEQEGRTEQLTHP